MPAFDLVAIGCGGGPSEHNLSCYLFKPYGVPWSDGILSLEAGSGIGALKQLLSLQPDIFGRRRGISDGTEGSKPYSAAEIYSWIRCFLVTHAHLDHVNGLVLTASVIGGLRRTVFGAHQCLADIGDLFSDRIWPRLASFTANEDIPLFLSALPADGQYTPVDRGMSVRMIPVSHGQNMTLGTYHSAAFFVRNDAAAREFLFFGDVEPDSIAMHPRNREVWRAAAGKIPDELSVVFLECSYPMGRREDMLYGHMSPEHLTAELMVLAEEVLESHLQKEAREESLSAPRKTHRRKPASLLVAGSVEWPLCIYHTLQGRPGGHLRGTH